MTNTPFTFVEYVPTALVVTDVDSDYLHTQIDLAKAEVLSQISSDSESVWNALDSEYKARTERDSDLNLSIELEAHDRMASDSDIHLLLDSEKHDRQADDSDLNLKIEQEIHDRASADSDLSVIIHALLDSEYKARLNADSDLQAHINTINERLDSDSLAIQSNLTHLENLLDSEYVKNAELKAYVDSRLDSDETALQDLSSRIDIEVVARTTEDANINTRIDNLDLSGDVDSEWVLNQYGYNWTAVGTMPVGSVFMGTSTDDVNPGATYVVNNTTDFIEVYNSVDKVAQVNVPIGTYFFMGGMSQDLGGIWKRVS